MKMTDFPSNMVTNGPRCALLPACAIGKKSIALEGEKELLKMKKASSERAFGTILYD